ncbi:uncharacterized protein ACMZJ9_009920 [Mantella aurantiaca]
MTKGLMETTMLDRMGGKEEFANLLELLKVEKYMSNKLTLGDILEIFAENSKDNTPLNIEDVTWYTLRKIMALDSTARNTLFGTDQPDLYTEEEYDPFETIVKDPHIAISIHPLDVLCVLLHCSDNILQQEIVSKMAMCQFAVPLLLPAGDGSRCTFMLWAMRDIVKKWRPQSLADSKGFQEENVVNISMPVISFVRLGKTKMSKSKILNQVLNPVQQHHNFFIHDDMEGGNIERKISEGLVEISWYFPGSKSGVYPEPFAVANLRGDLESHWDQFMFICDISSAVFIFMETINEREFQLLSKCSQSDTMFYFVVSPSSGKDLEKETKSILLRLLPVLRSEKERVIIKSKSENDANIMKKIEPKLQNVLKKCNKYVKLEYVPKNFAKHNFAVDENTEVCQKAKDFAHKITREIHDVTQYKKQTLKLQGDLWKDLSKFEKELCRMKNQGKENAVTYQSVLLGKCNDLRSEQYKHQTPKSIEMFIDALTDLSQKERQHFIKWMKFKLDAIARTNMTELQSIYKEKSTNNEQNKKELQDLDQRLSDSSLGIENFLRELGQFYEAESSMTKQKQIDRHQKKFDKLPGIAADLLLDGFPLEIIDGDASNIPLQWITDVLTELDHRTGGRCRLRVITVLGVQSTGKSTLLNTMFGLQFPVASGRCTRGAFMTLLNVKKDFQEKLGCHFILVIDTEGLKALELASLEDSYEHDNELATLVVGLSDITIINMAMENTTEMKNILQIVVHAFLRMKEIGKKPNCQFVHQNVSDVSAYDKNMRDRNRLLEQLNDMTKVAAKMEKKNDISTFTDVMKYDLKKDNWYIPGLWQGDPPMAPVNLGYSSNVLELKMYLFEFMEREKSINKPSSIPDFITWIESLWQSVKHEKFIFSFRNSLVAKAYNKLSVQYSLWEWDFCKTIYNWMISTEDNIKNQPEEKYESNTQELQNILLEEETKMTASLKKYFEDSENANLIERYREEFKLSITSLKKELERNALSRCREAVSIQKGKIQIQNIHRKSQTEIEDRITHLLQRYKGNNHEVSEQEIQQEFELMWKKTLSDLQLDELRRCNVNHSILHLLKKDMSNKGPHINEALIKVSDLYQYAKPDDRFCTENKMYFDFSVKTAFKEIFVKQVGNKMISDLAASIIHTSDEYVKEKLSSSVDYNEMYAKEMLLVINNILNRKDVKKINFNAQFELDIKLFIFGKASQAFQKLHDKFIHENDPKLCLEKLKPQYLSTFLSIFHKKDECQSRASQFCELCLKPAIMDYIFKHLGQKIVDEVLNDSENITFSSRSFFQCTVLEELLEEMSFQKYVEYTSSYESFVKQWILTYITNKYDKAPDLETLQGHILSSIDKKIKMALEKEICLKENSVSSFLKQFCELLKTELVISAKELKVITFHNSENVLQFASEIDNFLTDTQNQIRSELRSMDIQSVLSRVMVKPQDELFRKVVGCGKQCPFCKVPCEAGGGDHKNHAASIHRPQGLGLYRLDQNKKLMVEICSTLVVSNTNFKNSDTEWEWHPYKEYRTYYPDWAIQPDASIEGSDYWKYVFVKFNQQFAKEYKSLPADLPDIWKEITREQALTSLKKVFNINYELKQNRRGRESGNANYLIYVSSLLKTSVPYDENIMNDLQSVQYDESIMNNLQSVQYGENIMNDLQSVPYEESIMNDLQSVPYDEIIMNDLQSVPYDESIMNDLQSVQYDESIMNDLQSVQYDESIMNDLQSVPYDEIIMNDLQSVQYYENIMNDLQSVQYDESIMNDLQSVQYDESIMNDLQSVQYDEIIMNDLQSVPYDEIIMNDLQSVQYYENIMNDLQSVQYEESIMNDLQSVQYEESIMNDLQCSSVPYDESIMNDLQSVQYDESIMNDLQSVPYDEIIMNDLQSVQYYENIMNDLQSVQYDESIMNDLQSVQYDEIPRFPKKMERIRWLLVVSPVSVLCVVLIIMGLGYKKLWKRGKSKDEESAGILKDRTKLSQTKSVPSSQCGVKSRTENVSGPDGSKIPPLRNRESERGSSMGTGKHPISGATSHAACNTKSSVQRDSVRSEPSERKKRMPSNPAAQEKADQQLEKESRMEVDKRDSVRFFNELESTGKSEDEDKKPKEEEHEAASSRNLSDDSVKTSHQHHQRFNTTDEPLQKKSRTDVGERDSIRLLNELDTWTPGPSEGKISSDVKKPWEERHKAASTRNVIDNSVTSHQEFDITTGFRRPDSREHSEKSSQKGDYEDARRISEVKHDDTALQSSRSFSRAESMDIDSYTDPIKKMFLQKLMALDGSAREISSPNGGMSSDSYFDFNIEESDDITDSDAINPLDVLCDVLNDSDTLFQQEILTKMAMCQFALPLLLPAGDGSRNTFMLWATRDIVKKWKPHSLADSTGFVEDNLVNIPMPVFSFVRLGKCSLSKSKILNQVISPPEFIQNYFVHGDMPGGNVRRKCSDGLVEMCCYFPGGRGHSDIFPDPVNIINLRGDLGCHLEKFDLLSRVSSAVFVFIETTGNSQHDLLSKLVSQNPQIFLIVNFDIEKSDEDNTAFLNSLLTTLKLKKDKFIVKNRRVNNTQVVKTLQSKIKVLMANTEEKPTLEQIARKAVQLDLDIDENFKECENAREAAKQITDNIKNVLDYKRETMKLQGDLWKKLAKSEKEMCRMRKLEDRDVEEYKSQLQETIVQLRKQQSEHEPAQGVRQFLDALKKFSPTERKVFLKWLKIQLDALGRHQLAKLNDEYRKLLTDVIPDANALMEIDQKLADSSLGVEHYIRELGQFYEVEHAMGKQKMSRGLPKTAADLLLAGFPLELIDGDASNIPLQWISDVLNELDMKTGRNCTIRVITVLGVQSTGKSTLLNTMFGLHLPTSSGRCTRGAFMTLLNAKKNFHEDLGCDYVMVIDTEGLKSMELASLEGSYEHDNELATVAVGLSDITIVNMAMENTEEMKDILQIVIHAFLRMKEVGKKSSCQFVHQNVSDVSAHVKNRKAREKFLEQLNEMTKVSARMEKKGGVTSFSDIIHCDIESNSWYIPGLWHGIPPMASINYGYSENVQELKKALAGYLKSMTGKPQNILQFKEWMKSLWNAVKHEKFVFSFRNRLVTEAYNQLCMQYSDWEWRFQKNSHDWMIKTETLIFNLSSSQFKSQSWDRIHNEMKRLLDEQENVMERSLEKYFKDDCDNAHLLEAFKGDFSQSIKYLRKSLEIVLLNKCDETIKIQKEKCQIQALQERYIGLIEEKVSDLMDKIRKDQYLENAEQLNREFETVWRKTTSILPTPMLKKRNIELEILQQLKRDMHCDDSNVIQKLHGLTSLNQYKGKDFSMKGEYLQGHSKRDKARAEALARSVLGKCNEKVTEMANSKKDFNDIYSLELLKVINDDLNGHDVEDLGTTKLFELNLKLCVLGNAAVTFQRMHEEFVRSNDPQSYLEEMKPQYFFMFINMFETRTECQRRAKQFCTVCLKPAIVDHISRSLGKEIVDDVLQRNGPPEFKNRKILQREVLKTLLDGGSSREYAEYVNSYEHFMKRWISRRLTERYKGRDTIRTLQANILQSLMVKVEEALNDVRTLQAKTISAFLAELCNILKEDLVIAQNSTKVVIFQSNLKTIKQFAHDIKLNLADLEELVMQDFVDIETTFLELSLKPQDELFRKVVGCGKQCPFCKAPCEAGGGDHKEHFTSVHRPRGLAQHVNEETQALDHSICSSNVISNKSFRNADTDWRPHPYKDYCKYYPDWAIYPDTTAGGSDYWKFVLKEFNCSLAELFDAKPANLPEHWHKLTKEQARKSLQETLY